VPPYYIVAVSNALTDLYAAAASSPRRRSPRPHGRRPCGRGDHPGDGGAHHAGRITDAPGPGREVVTGPAAGRRTASRTEPAASACERHPPQEKGTQWGGRL